MNNKIREIQNKYIPFIEEYEWLDSYADEIWREAQKELLQKIDEEFIKVSTHDGISYPDWENIINKLSNN